MNNWVYGDWKRNRFLLRKDDEFSFSNAGFAVHSRLERDLLVICSGKYLKWHRRDGEKRKRMRLRLDQHGHLRDRKRTLKKAEKDRRETRRVCWKRQKCIKEDISKNAKCYFITLKKY